MSENQESKINIENEPSVTMVDVLEQEKELEDESTAVLGGSDEKCCTYPQGYIKRQALYSCLTCCPEARNDIKKSAGICLACSYNCHENHELIELYTKRNFRCDCPTDRIIGKKCTFANALIASTSNINGSGVFDVANTITSDGKLTENMNNEYNQNFTGVYCICHRPYPDTAEDAIQDEMIQCVGCEDWYHTSHLDWESNVPQPSEYAEMICGKCMEKHDFLKDYVGFAVQKIKNSVSDKKADESPLKIVEDKEDDDKLKSELDKSISDIMNMTEESTSTSTSKATENIKDAVEEIKEKENGECDEPKRKKIKIDEIANEDEICKRPIILKDYKKGAIFWPDNWRNMICKCKICSKVYVEQNVSFLLDPEDTVQFYEENGMKKFRESDYERGIRALSSIGHTQQVDAITEYNRMKEKLKEYLHTFVVNKKVVTEEDINTFFQGMKNEKNNSKLGQQSHYCR